MKRLFKKIPPITLLVLFVTLIYGLTITFSEFYGTPFNGLTDFLIIAMQGSVIVFATFGLIYLLALNRYVFAATFPLITGVCALLTYFRFTLNIALTPMLIDLAFINDTQTCLDVFSWQLVVLLLLAIGLSVVAVWYRWHHIHVTHIYYHLATALTIIVLTNGIIPQFVRPVSERLPYSIFYCLSKYVQEKRIVLQKRDTFVIGKATCPTDSLTVVFVIGESLRADHLQMNGYARHTMPLLSGDTAVVSYPHIHSIPYYTHTSIPHILTRADSLHPQIAYSQQSFITLFNQAGFHTTWLANQESVDTYVYFMNECNKLYYANRGKSLYRFDQWLDSDLFPYYDKVLQTKASKQLLILHTIGSHWWYNTHFTPSYAKFQPIIHSRVVSACSRQEMINSYDNTICYTDYVLHSLIDKIKKRRAILIYLSDHGEALGENGCYLHADDYPELHNPACFVWYSESYAKTFPKKVQQLKNNREKRFLTDFLFHSILDAANIHSSYLNKNESIFREKKP